MDLAAYRLIAPALNADLTAALAKHGLRLQKLSASVEEGTGDVRYAITAADQNLKDEAGAPTTAEAERYKALGALIGLKQEWLGQTFRLSAGRLFTVLGMAQTRSPKCIAIEINGKRMLCDPNTLIRAAGR